MLYTLGALLSFAVQNLGMKEFSRRFPEGMAGSYLISGLATLVGGIILALFGNLYVESGPILLWSVAYGALYAAALIVGVVAVATGPLNIVSLLGNMSLVIPVVFGLFFWGETLSVPGAIGLALIMIVLVLGSGGKQEGARPMTTRWKIFMSLSFLGNGALAIYRHYFAEAYPTASSGAFMCWACLTSAVMFALLLLIFCGTGGTLKPWFEKGKKKALGLISVATGAGIAFGNMFSLMAVVALPSVIVYPIMQGGLIPLLWLFCVPLYKEKITKRSLLALVLGLAGIVLLNL